jgi:hypothetical protein
MSEKKQTAVEWFFDKMKSHFEHDGDLFETFCMTYSIAKTKERDQIKNAYDWGETNGSDESNGDGPTHDNFEQYFNETYKQP